MRRTAIALAIGSLFALPAFADGEIGKLRAGTDSGKTRAQVVSEIAAQDDSASVDGETGQSLPRS